MGQRAVCDIRKRETEDLRKGGNRMGFFVLCLFACMIVAMSGAGPFDNCLAFFVWSFFVFIPIIVSVLLCITVSRENDKDDDGKN